MRRLADLQERETRQPDVQAVADNAEQAFWAAVAESFPEAKSGDLDPMTAVRFSKAAKDAVREWVAWNVTGATDSDS